MRVAAIDIGSNSILLAIAEKSDSQSGYKLIEDRAKVTGIAKGLDPDSKVPEEKLQKSLDTLKDYAALIQRHSVDKLKVVATEGLRKPRNSDEIRERLQAGLGHPIEIIDGDREAELSFKSVSLELRAPTLVFDIGGASTEIIYGSPTGIQKKESLKLGSVLLCREFNMTEASSYKEAVSYVLEALRLSSFKNQDSIKVETAAGVAGTITSLASVLLKLKTYSRSRIHRHRIRIDELRTTLEELSKLPLIERMNVPGLIPERADVFPAGLSIALALAEHFQWKDFLCMDSGVRIGLIYEMLGLD